VDVKFLAFLGNYINCSDSVRIFHGAGSSLKCRQKILDFMESDSYHAHKNLMLDHTLNQMNAVHILTLCFSNMHFNNNLSFNILVTQVVSSLEVYQKNVCQDTVNFNSAAMGWTKLQWLQNSSQKNGDNLNNVKYGTRTFRKKNLIDKIRKLETNNENKNIRLVYMKNEMYSAETLVPELSSVKVETAV
jgi:hypothetical protein